MRTGSLLQIWYVECIAEPDSRAVQKRTPDQRDRAPSLANTRGIRENESPAGELSPASHLALPGKGHKLAGRTKMFSTFREHFNGKTAGAVAIGGASLVGLGAYASAGAAIGWLLGFKIGSVGWFAVMLGWPVLPFAACVLGLLGLSVLGHDLGDWCGDSYDY